MSRNIHAIMNNRFPQFTSFWGNAKILVIREFSFLNIKV